MNSETKLKNICLIISSSLLLLFALHSMFSFILESAFMGGMNTAINHIQILSGFLLAAVFLILSVYKKIFYHILAIAVLLYGVFLFYSSHEDFFGIDHYKATIAVQFVSIVVAPYLVYLIASYVKKPKRQ
ncbi:MAG: hypothetical protein BGN88_15730 [Clostridiales bacterium 43-6]|nr:MAG: hypothetical protein BGN88_15730 [Clostridiales bacterium 43-6]